MPLQLYDHPFSPYAQKVKITLIEKGLEYIAPLPTGIGSGSTPGEFTKASPRGEVPALLDGDVRIFDSTIILEYLEEKWPTPALMPKDPARRARARMIEDVMDTHFEAINWGLAEIHNFGRAQGTLKDAMVKRAGEQLNRWFLWLAAQLGDAPYFGGEQFDRIDLSVIPYLNGARGFGFTPTNNSKLAQWSARVNERDSLKRCVADISAMLSQQAGQGATLTNVRDMIERGEFKREYRDHRLEWMIKTGGISVVEEGLKKDNIRFISEFPV